MLLIFHHGDSVEEIATGLLGTVRQPQNETGKGTTACIVDFAVGGKQQSNSFNVDSISGLRLINCPHQPTELSISPTEPLA